MDAKANPTQISLKGVDFETQRRILKDSALWYKQVIAKNGFNEQEPNLETG
jgi:beta-glucosidase/6-phospho-beta-glucosidase/beta-galactosidase